MWPVKTASIFTAAKAQVRRALVQMCGPSTHVFCGNSSFCAAGVWDGFCCLTENFPYVTILSLKRYSYGAFIIKETTFFETGFLYRLYIVLIFLCSWSMYFPEKMLNWYVCAYVGVCMYGFLVLEVFSAVILSDKLLLTILMSTCTPDLSRKICLFVFVCVLISCEPVIDLAFPLVTRWHCLFAECR